MSEREAFEPPTLPRCPRCGESDQSERVSYRWRKLDPRYLCGRCDIVYTGSPSEWEAERKARELAAADLSSGNRLEGLG